MRGFLGSETRDIVNTTGGRPEKDLGSVTVGEWWKRLGWGSR